MRSHPDSRTGFLLAFLSAAAFGALPIFGKLAYAEGFAVPTLLAWRFSIAAALLWSLVLLRRAPRRVTAGIGRRRAALLTLGVLFTVNSGLYFLALERIPATTTSLVFYVYPAVVAILGTVLFGRRLERRTWVALGLALGGVALTVGYARGPLDYTGVGMALGAACVVSFYFLLGEVALPGVPTAEATALILTGTALTFWTWEVLVGTPSAPPSERGWAIVSALAILSTALPMLAMLGAVRRIGAEATAILGTLEPAVTAALAAVFLGERLAPRQALGGALILSGVALLRLASRRRALALAEA